MHDNRNDVVAADYPIILYDGLMDNIASKNDFRTLRAVLECFYGGKTYSNNENQKISNLKIFDFFDHFIRETPYAIGGYRSFSAF